MEVDSQLDESSSNPVENSVVTQALSQKASTAVATTQTAGLMSAQDKSKLEGLVDGYLGYYATSEALIAAHPTGESGQFASVGSTDTIWAWDSDTSSWVNTDTNTVTVSWNNVSGKPNFAAVATSGSYTDLSDKPTIPVVDAELSDSSENAIQNKAVANAVDALVPKLGFTISASDSPLIVRGINGSRMLGITQYAATLGPNADTTGQTGSTAVGYGCYSGQYTTAAGMYCRSSVADAGNVLFGYGLNLSTTGHSAYGRYCQDVSGASVIVGCGTSDNDRANALTVSQDKSIDIWQETKFAKSVVSPGAKIVALSSVSNIQPLDGIFYTYTLTGEDTITLATPVSGYCPTFELWLTQPETAVAAPVWGTTVVWDDGTGYFTPDNAAPDFSSASTLYCVVLRYNGARWLGNVAYTEVLTNN